MGSRNRNLRIWIQETKPKALTALPGSAGGDSERAWDEGLGRASPRVRVELVVAHKFPQGSGRRRTAKSRQGAPRPRLLAALSCCGRELSRLRCGPKAAPAPPPRAAGAPSPPLGAGEGRVLCCKSLLRPALLLGVNE